MTARFLPTMERTGETEIANRARAEALHVKGRILFRLEKQSARSNDTAVGYRRTPSKCMAMIAMIGTPASQRTMSRIF